MSKNTNTEENKLKKILYDNISKLFEKLDNETRELEELESKLKGDRPYKQKKIGIKED